MGRRLEQSEIDGDIGKLCGEIFATVEQVDDLGSYVREKLVPMMDERRRRSEPLSAREIVDKLFSIDWAKPGEAMEVIEARIRSRWRITPAVALEIADIIYCCSQPQCPEYLSNPEPLITSCGIDMDTAFAFCVVKYHTRILYGDMQGYQEVEEIVMRRFIERLSRPKTRPFPRG